jgi:biopolymer transport protein ExbB/TolQ
MNIMYLLIVVIILLILSLILIYLNFLKKKSNLENDLLISEEKLNSLENKLVTLQGLNDEYLSKINNLEIENS